MQHKKTITVLVAIIGVAATVATTLGIFTHDGSGPYSFTSIRGRQVQIYGRGLYRHMSAEVAPQGIAQDYVTLFLGVPLLLLALVQARSGSMRGRLLFTGTTAYFLVTYLFYLVMGMYNQLFLGYVILAGASFFTLVMLLVSFDQHTLPGHFGACTPIRSGSAFLIFNAAAIALLWLSIVVPPLLDGSIVPVQAEHYTTLIVQGLDLGILLPAAVVCALLFKRRQPLGYLLAPVYYIFLSLLMTALTAKVTAMALLGYNVVPAVFIIPAFNLISLFFTIAILRQVDNSITGNNV